MWCKTGSELYYRIVQEAIEKSPGGRWATVWSPPPISPPGIPEAAAAWNDHCGRLSMLHPGLLHLVEPGVDTLQVGPQGGDSLD